MMNQLFKSEKIMFISRGLEKILTDRDIRRSHNQQLKKACEQALESIKNEQSGIEENHSSSSTLPQPKLDSKTFDEEKYFVPFELACQSKSSRIVTVSLDCIQKLIVYGYFTGNKLDTRTDGKRLLIDSIVVCVCNCFQGPTTDDDVQLQIIKALLTIVTSQSCPVHENSILTVVQTCYYIYLASKNLVNQTTAKATLTQMLNVIFSRMESFSAPKNSSTETTQVPLCDTTAATTVNGEKYAANSTSIPAWREYLSLKRDSDTVQDILVDIIDSVCQSFETNAIEQRNGDLADTESIGSFNEQEIGAKKSHLRNSSFGNASSTTITMSNDGFGEANDSIPLKFENVHQKDAYLVFRSLCRLSMKHELSENSDINIELRSKILSLQLILQILQNSGPVFQSSDMFAVAIKQYLCVALSKNGVSNVPEIFKLSLNIFLILIQKFKTYLKMQIEVFFKEIFLNILETASSSLEHKRVVIQALTRICADAQCVVDIYVNYDCDLSCENIFGRLVNDLSKIAQGGGGCGGGQMPDSDESSMRKKGLECLVSILQCMVVWSKDLHQGPLLSANQQQQQQQQPQNEHTTTEANGKENESCSLHESSSIGGKLDRLQLSDDPGKFEVAKNQKNIIDHGIELFNRNAAKGLKYLQQNLILEENAEAVARFFHSNDRLDKSQIGDYMGEGHAFNKEVMYAYVDQMDFSGRDIVSALRFFLEGFRLPGEAQKVDRFMEKFASRFFQKNINQGMFSSADTAYVLAYSIIMLTTDLHSPQVKSGKMTKEDYIKLNRGINECKDLPEEYLSQIYDQIAESEIKMKGQGSVKKVTGKVVTSEKTRRLLYNKEMETMASTARALIESVSNVESQFTSAKHFEHVRPMFRTSWTSFLAAFSLGLQDCDDCTIASFCLNGLKDAIRIAGIFAMNLERDAFVQALARFTLLNANGPLTDMKTKNINTIKTLIEVANTEGNYLGKSWFDILRVFSQLELAQLIGTGVKPQVLNNNSLQINSNGNAFGFPFKFESFVPLDSLTRNRERDSKISESIVEASSQSIVVAVDRVFTTSDRLDGNAIVDFVRALCKVSSEELSNVTNPRMFSLQKIVEISYYNMNRIRLQWSRIWEVLGDHFNKVGCNANEEIAFFAIDSLRQLSMKFIEKGELSNFRFQKDFLRPFEYIMKLNSSITIRDMVVRCIAHMVNSQASNIKSGWKNIFSVFRIAASENDAYIFDLAFQTTCNIFNNIYESNFISMIDSFQDAVKCLSEFGCNQNFPDTSMEAIRLIRASARYVAERPQYFKEFNIDDKTGGLLATEDDGIWVRGWLPILFELSCIVNICKLDVRTRALTVMFEIIKSHGNTFRENWWADLFKIIFRIFDSLKLPGPQIEKNEWMATTCNHALYSIVDVFTQFFDMLGSFLLKDVYSQLFWCVQQDNEQLARSGINCFENLVISCGVKYDLSTWTMTIEFIERIYDAVRPNELIESANQLPLSTQQQQQQPLGKPQSQQQKSLHQQQQQQQQKHLQSRELQELVKVKFLVQLDLIQAIDNIVFFPSFSRKQDIEIANELEEQLKAREYVSDYGSNHHHHNKKPKQCGGMSGSIVSAARSSVAGTSGNIVAQSLHNASNGMYVHMSTASLLRLAKFLAKVFDISNQLYLDKSKMKLLTDKLSCLSAQETKSLLCALRILFCLYDDERRKQCWPEVEKELIGTCSKALKYYYEIENEYNRENWNAIIILILYNISKLPLDKFRVHTKAYYRLVCDLILLDLKPSLKVLIRKNFLRLE